MFPAPPHRGAECAPGPCARPGPGRSRGQLAVGRAATARCVADHLEGEIPTNRATSPSVRSRSQLRIDAAPADRPGFLRKRDNERSKSLTDIPGNEASVVTTGNFDGMHNGHKKVIRSHLRGACAHSFGVDAVAITFDLHLIQVAARGGPPAHLSAATRPPDAMAAAGPDATPLPIMTRASTGLGTRRVCLRIPWSSAAAVVLREVVVGEDLRFDAATLNDFDTLPARPRTPPCFDVPTVTGHRGT